MAGRIEDYALIGDMQTAALVSLDGSIDWLCFPRFDSDACFAALLGDERNGNWRIAPAGADRCTRRSYRKASLVLESVWETRTGTVRVIDFMPPRGEAPDVVRIVEGISGRVTMRSELRLRFGYGRVVPWVRRIEGGIKAIAGPNSVWLHSDVEAYGKDYCTYSDFTAMPGDRTAFVLTWHPSYHSAPKPVDPEQALADTEAFWRSWVKKCTYKGPARDAVVRSLITLKALTYAPTGGIVAAATTSLPEAIGGVRNWDYRYCWLRDATMTLSALLRSGYTAEAQAWREWLLRAIAGSPKDVQIMYDIMGNRRLPEFELDWLPGYEGSRPVRIGNAAVNQVQLDVYGEVVDALHLALCEGIPPDRHAWSLQRALLTFLESHWKDPDQGLWESRGAPQHFVHSKIMAWVAADRAVRTLRRLGLPENTDRWEALRDEIHRDVCENGFDPTRNTFTQYYGSKELDAALLLIPQVGFLPPDDPRVVGTIEAIERELCDGGLVLRYTTSTHPDDNVDGLPGHEGVFLACSFWLADSLALIGRRQEAEALFERLLGLQNDVGMLSEEWDPRTGRQLGNTPQAFTHVALINTAHNLMGPQDARKARTGHPDVVREVVDVLGGDVPAD